MNISGSVFGHKDPNNSPPPPRETKKKLACSASTTAVAVNNNGLLASSANSRTHNSRSVVVKAARSVQTVSAERSYSVSEPHHPVRSNHAVHRTPHRTAGYGGAGQPSRGPHRYSTKIKLYYITFVYGTYVEGITYMLLFECIERTGMTKPVVLYWSRFFGLKTFPTQKSSL